jgi:small GTP-binding protein
MIGDTGTGKSCILKRLTEGKFMEEHDVTVGVEFGLYQAKVENKICRQTIWDTAGQESFKSMTKIFYRGADAVLLCYSIICSESFANIIDWLKDIR